MKPSHELATNASFRRSAALCMAGVAVASAAMQPSYANEGVRKDERQLEDDWKLEHRERFDGTQLPDSWEVIERDDERGSRFMQYQPFNVRISNGKAVITSRRHCLDPGEQASLSNTQVEPCDDGKITSYTSGRIEAVEHDIGGDFKLEVTAKMPLGRTRGEVWLNNLDETPGSGNEGYCIEGTTSTAEIDLMESYGDDVARASHHVHCDNGEIAEVSRKKRFPKGWLKKIHTYGVERIGGKMTFYVDGTPIPLREDKDRVTDTPRDFEGVSLEQFYATYEHDFGFIFSTYVFDDPSSTSRSFAPPSPDEDFTTQKMHIFDVKQYSKRH